MPSVNQLCSFGNPQHLPWFNPIELVIGLEFEASLDHKDHLVIQKRPGDLRTFPACEANTHIWRNFIAKRSSDRSFTGWATAVNKLKISVIDESYWPIPGDTLHSSLLLFQAAIRIRVRTPNPRNGSGGLRDGMPVTDLMSWRCLESEPTAISASRVPEIVPQAAPTPLSQAVA
ncbi:hypothetical protein D3C71_1632170 [compost metagenome]